MADDTSWMDAMPAVTLPGQAPPAAAAPSAAPASAKSDTSWMDQMPAVTLPHEAAAKAQGKQSTLNGVVANAGAGTSDALASTLGAPVDLATGAINLIPRGINAVAGTNIPTIQNPVGGSDWFRSAEGLVGADPRNVPTNGTAEQLARSAGAGAASMVLPGGIAKALPELPGIAGAVQGAFSHGSVPGQAATGAVAGVGGQAAENVVPEPYKPLANAAGQILAGGLAGAGGSAAKALTGAAADRVGNFVAPMRAAGQKRIAAQTYFGPAHDLADVRETLNNPPAPLVPGSEPTTYQLTGDQGLGDVERAAKTRAPDQFLQRANQQNTARVGAVEGTQTTGDPGAVGSWFRGQLADADAADEAVRGQQQQKAQAATTALGGNAPDLQSYGETLRGGLNDADQAAKARVGKLYDAIDPDGNLAMDMSGFRNDVQQIAADRPQSAKPMTGETQAIFGTAMLQPKVQSLQEVAALRSRVGDAMRAAASDPTQAQEYRQLTRLRGALDNAMDTAVQQRATDDAQAVASGAMTPEQSIMGRISAQDGNAGRQAEVGSTPLQSGGNGGVSGFNGANAGAQGGVSAGAREYVPGQGRQGNASGRGPVSPEPTTPLAGPNRKPESLHDFIIQKGGVRDWSGELKGADLDRVHHRAGGRLLNPKGMDADYMRMMARDAGYPVGDTMATFGDAVRVGDRVFRPEDEHAAVARTQESTQSAQESEARYDARDRVAQVVDQAGVRANPAEIEHAAELVMQGAHPEEALRQAVGHSEDVELQHNAQRNGVGAPGTPLAEQQALPIGETSRLTPNFDEAALARKRAADTQHRERMGTFGSKVPGVGRALAKGQSSTEFKLPASQVPAELFGFGKAAPERIQAFKKAASGNKDLVDTLQDYAAHSFRKAAEGEDGTIDPGKAAKWLKQHEQAMTEFPELSGKFKNAATARQTLDDIAARQAENRKALQTEAVSRMMGEADPVKTVGRILNSDGAAAQMQDLARRTAGSPEARAGLRRAVVEHVLENTRTTAAGMDEMSFKPKPFQDFVRNNAQALRSIFSKDEIENLQNVAADVQRANKSIVGTKLPGGSNTPQDLAAGAKHGHGGQSVLSQLIIAEVAGDMAHSGASIAGHGALSHIIGPAAKFVALAANFARANGMKKIDDLVTEAALHPGLAKSLLAHLPKNDGAARSLGRVIGDQLKAVSGVGAVAAGRDYDRN